MIEKMKIVDTSLNGWLKNVFYWNISKDKGRGDSTSSWGKHKNLHGEHFKMKVNFMEMDLSLRADV
jgi:hypothetical protein